MDVVPGEEYPHNSTTPTRGAEPHSRCRVSDHEGPFRLEAGSQAVPEDRPGLGPIEVDLFASRLTTQCQVYFSWCREREADPFSGPITNVINFLAFLHEKGYQYNSVNSYRSAISSVHEKIDGYSVGQHPMVTRLLKGVFHNIPPLPRYTSTWKVEQVLTYIKAMGSNQDLSLKQLTWKVTMLLALTRPSRSTDLSNLDLTG